MKATIQMLACCATALVLAFAPDANAQSDASSPAAEPLLAGQADVNSLMNLTQGLSRFADKLQPGSSGIIVLGAVGFSLNPQFASYDMARPFSVLAYSRPGQGAALEGWSFCGVLCRRRDKSPSLVKFGPWQLRTRDYEGRSALATDERLLEILPESLRKNLPDEMPSATPDAALKIDAQALAKCASLADVFAPQTNAATLDPTALEELQAKRARFQALDSLLKQISEAKLTLSLEPGPRPRAKMEATLKPLPLSPLEAFLKRQGAQRMKMAGAISVDGASVFGAARLAATPELTEALGLLCAKVSEASGDDKRAAAFQAFSETLTSNANEGASFCAGLRRGTPFQLVSLRLDKEGVARLKKACGSLEISKSASELRLLREWKSGVRSYCLFDEERVWLLRGVFGDEAAERILATRHAEAPSGDDCEGLLGYVSASPEAGAQRLFEARVEDSSLKAKLDISPDDLDCLPLPPPPPPKKTKGFKMEGL